MYWTTAMNGMHRRYSVIRSGVNSMSPKRAISPEREADDARDAGRHRQDDLGKGDLLDEPVLDATDNVASPTDAENHFHGRIAEKMKSG